MDELVKLVSQKTGLSEEMSKMAVQTVLDYLKSKVPAPVASQIDSIISGGGDMGNLGNLAQGLGGIFGQG